tara:strand:- start:183 stop:368 length:186 start_codon:yes stop_codon:yes gene_type:complete
MFFDTDGFDQLSNHIINSSSKIVYRRYVIDHLNQSLFISSPVGRLNSYIKAFLDKYVELRN